MATPKKEWQDVFITELCETGNVSHSARRARVARQTAYEERERNPAFAVAWEEALDISTEALELEARRRAQKGVLEPIFQGGQKVGSVRKYSDTLLIFLLKAHRPDKYRDRTEVTGRNGGAIQQEVTHAGHIDFALLSDAQLFEIATGQSGSGALPAQEEATGGEERTLGAGAGA